MTDIITYLIDIQDTNRVFYSEDNKRIAWIQAFKFGKFKHPVGEIVFDETNLNSLVDSVNSGERGIELATDYEHREYDIASGWIKKAKLVQDNPNPDRNGVYFLVEWTKNAAKKIKEKEYKYFSPSFNFTNYKVLGGGLTNRPFLKGMAPINLSEFDVQQESDLMNRAQLLALAKKLGLEYQEDISDEDLAKLVDDYEPPTLEENEEEESEEEEVKPELVGALSEKEIAAKLNEQEEQIARLTLANRLAQTDVRLSEYKGKLTPKLIQKLRKAVIRLSEENSKLVFEFADSLLEDKHNLAVLLSEEQGNSTDPEIDLVDVETKIDKAVAKYTERETNPLSYGDALLKVQEEDPELFQSFRNIVYGGAQ